MSERELAYFRVRDVISAARGSSISVSPILLWSGPPGAPERGMLPILEGIVASEYNASSER